MSAEIVRPTSPESAAGGTVECDAGGKSTSYELFIGAISILSLVNLLLFLLPMDDDEHRVIVALDLFLALVLLTDFTYRLITAPNRARYFVRQGDGRTCSVACRPFTSASPGCFGWCA